MKIDHRNEDAVEKIDKTRESGIWERKQAENEN